MTGIFLSYRGMHHSYAPMFVHSVLRQRFGDGLVFEAGYVNQPGVHFGRSIGDWLDRCSVLVVFIDRYWLRRTDMLREESDWVRKEILYFLEHDKPIVPLLLDGARMPRKVKLPAELAELTRWIGLPLASANANADLLRLIGRLEQVSPDLVLAALHEPLPTNPTPAALLRPEYEVFPFRPRPEFDDLVAWVVAPDVPPFRLVTGPSGAGKTRLALRLCAELAASRPTIMLPRSATPAALARLSETATPFLVLIDDAESRPDTVLAAARALAEGGSAARVLLLTRSDDEWLRDLADDPDDRVSLLLSRIPTIRLAVPQAVDGDFAVAYAALADRLGRVERPTPDPPSTGSTLLGVQAAALAVLDSDGDVGTTPWSRIAARERCRWIETAAAWKLPELRPRSVTELVTAVTMFGAQHESEARRLLTRLRAFDGFRAMEVDVALALVRVMLPGPLALNPVQPQPVANEFIAEHLRGGDRLTGVLDVVSDDQARNAVLALGSCVAAFPDLVEAAGELLGAVHGRLLATAMTALPAVAEPGALVDAMTRAVPGMPTEDLVRLVDTLPLRSETLAGFAVALTRRAVEAQPAGDDADATTARLQRLLAIRLLAAGGPAAEAVRAAEAALRGFPEPGAERAEAYATLAQARDQEGSPEAAREAGEQAVAMFRQFASDDRTRAALATAMINQAHRDEAQAELAVEAYKILSELDVTKPNRYRSLFADAIDLLVARTRDEHLARRSLGLRRILAAARPDAYQPALAAALFNLGALLGSGAEATELLRESEWIFAELAAASPERYGMFLDQVHRRINAHD
ncbi:hypothetical protein GCM10029963_74930 [Micromonospora andamanensis]|nr:hypothetical protein Vwe01_60080 [Micromonospora andamanensis]